MGKRVCLVIRYDDYGAAYSPCCAARFDVEQMIDRETRARGWSWLCGITPRQSVDPENVREERTVSLWEDHSRIELVRSAVSDGFCEPAVHGLTHHTWKQLPRYGMELAGQSAERQLEILRVAKREVQQFVERKVDVLIPPWNRFDEGTVWAATQAGFTLLSGSIATVVRDPSPLRLVPATLLPMQLQQLMNRGERFARGSVVVLLIHPADFTSVNEQMGYLRNGELCELLDRAVEHFDMEVVRLEEAARRVGPAIEERTRHGFTLNQRYRAASVIPLIGRKMQEWIAPYTHALLPPPDARRIVWVTDAALCLWFLAVIAVGCLPVVLTSGVVQSGAGRSRVLLAWAVVGFAITIYAARNAILKWFHNRWGARHVGIRTWTGMVGGGALAAASMLWWATD